MEKRLDVILFEKGLFKSREKAREAVESGIVKVNDNVAKKPGAKYNEDERFEIFGEIMPYVGKGGLKLEKAIKEFNIIFENKTVLDIGSSTGGFTDCALINGARKVYAVDVGSDQLDEKLRNDTRVISKEKTDFRNVNIAEVMDTEVVTIDVSFISVTLLIEKLNELKNDVEIITLIKPQFECGPKIGKKYKGIILNKEIHKSILKDVIEKFESYGFKNNAITFSPITGGEGNIEYLAYFKKNDSRVKFNLEDLVNRAFDEMKAK